ncbi:MAG: hypothetical protein ABFQ89_02535 [Chloroflexota bacterium]
MFDNPTFVPLAWFAGSLIAIWLSARWIHRHLFLVGAIITGNDGAAAWLFAVILFPGVFVHETSHWLCAKVLGIRTEGMSLIPRLRKTGELELGSTRLSAKVDPIRESIIGAAPLIVGFVILYLLANHVFGVAEATSAVSSWNIKQVGELLAQGYQTNDFYLWAYLSFSVGNTMIPSASDRRAWPIIVAIGAVLLLTAYALQAPSSYIVSAIESTTSLVQNMTAVLILAVTINVMVLTIFLIVEAVWIFRGGTF